MTETTTSSSTDKLKSTKSERKTPLVIFVHLPKTGGLTISFVLRCQYSDKACLSFYRMEQEHKIKKIKRYTQAPNSFKVIRGHIGYGIHRRLKEEKYIYFTILREPISRIVSDYFFHKDCLSSNYECKRISRITQRIETNQMDLRTYVSEFKFITLDNYQTRLIVGDTQGLKPEYGECPPEFLDIARRHLENQFAVVGVTERFDETLLVLQKVLGWEIPLYISQNVGKSRTPKKVIEEDIIDTITKHNQLDIALYQYANERLDQLIAENFKFFKLHLFWFRFINRFYNYFYLFSRFLPKSVQEDWDVRFFAKE